MFTAINNFPADILLLSLMDYKNHGCERCLRSVDASYIATITADLRLEKIYFLSRINNICDICQYYYINSCLCHIAVTSLDTGQVCHR